MNYPDDFRQSLVDDFHYQECEDQPEGKMCICDDVRDSYEDFDPQDWRATYTYNEEVKNVILEGVKI